MPLARGVNIHKGHDVNIFYTVDVPEGKDIDDPNLPTVVHVMGFGGQLFNYPYNTLVAPLTHAGYRVIRIDNRTMGDSTPIPGDVSITSTLTNALLVSRDQGNTIYNTVNLDYNNPNKDQPKNIPKKHKLPLQTIDYRIEPGIHPLNLENEYISTGESLQTDICPLQLNTRYTKPNFLTKWLGVKKASIEYDLGDMALDVILLLQQLSIYKAHFCGVSMGGMIIQLIAAIRPSMIQSLSLIMTSTGHPSGFASLFLLAKLGWYNPPPAPNSKLSTFASYTTINNNYIGYPEPTKTLNAGQDPYEFYNDSVHRLLACGTSGVGHQTALLASAEARDFILDWLAPRFPILIFHGDHDELVPTINAHYTYRLCSDSLSRPYDGCTYGPKISQLPQQKVFAEPITPWKRSSESNNNNTSSADSMVVTSREPRLTVQTILAEHPIDLQNPQNHQQNQQQQDQSNNMDDIVSSSSVPTNTTTTTTTTTSNQVYTRLCILDSAAHELSDDYCTYLTPLLLDHFKHAQKCNQGQDILSCDTFTLPDTLPTPVWGTEQHPLSRLYNDTDGGYYTNIPITSDAMDNIKTLLHNNKKQCEEKMNSTGMTSETTTILDNNHDNTNTTVSNDIDTSDCVIHFNPYTQFTMLEFSRMLHYEDTTRKDNINNHNNNTNNNKCDDIAETVLKTAVAPASLAPATAASAPASSAVKCDLEQEITSSPSLPYTLDERTSSSLTSSISSSLASSHHPDFISSQDTHFQGSSA